MPDRAKRAIERITAEYPAPIIRKATGAGTVKGRPRKRSNSEFPTATRRSVDPEENQ